MSDDYFSSPRFKRVLRLYEEAERNGEPCIISVEDYADIADWMCDRGRIDEARRVAEQACRLFPDSYQPWVLMSRFALMYDNDIAAAKNYLDRVKDKTEREYIYTLGEIYIAENLISMAEVIFEEYYDDLPDDEKDMYCLDVAELFMDHDLIIEAHRWLDTCGDHDCTDYKELRARIMMDDDDEDSERLLNELLDEDPYSCRYWNALASLHYMHKDIDKAIECHDFALAVNPSDGEALTGKAGCLVVNGCYEEAVKCYDRYIDAYPDEPGGYMFRAVSLLMLSRCDEALADLKKGESLTRRGDEHSEMLYLQISQLLGFNGYTDEALAYIEKADAAYHLTMSMKQARRGSVYLSAGRFGEACKCFDKACTDQHMSTETLMEIALAFYNNKYTDMAYKLFGEIIKAGRKEEKNLAYPYMAVCCYYLRKKSEFVKYVRMAVKAYPFHAQDVLRDLFPENMDVNDYPAHARNMTK